MKTLSAYLHIPFCERKCIYCDFYSIENLSLREEFVDLLLREIELKLASSPALSGRTLETIFFGGGTPSLLTPGELERIIQKLSFYFEIASDCEFTMECNPGTVTLEKLAGYKALGVNRLSFGVQSFDAEELTFLGRIHDANQAREAVSLARQAGFDNVSIDLIFALPGQTEATLNRTLDEAIALETDHISAYNLIVERGTPLFRLVQLGKVIELDSNRAANLFSIVQERLCDAGFEQYEISNYAKVFSHETSTIRHSERTKSERSGDLRSEESRGNETRSFDSVHPSFGGRNSAQVDLTDKVLTTRARHNLVYWDGFRDYVSFGPSAHEFVSGDRAWNVSSLEEYGKAVRAGKLPIINRERLTQEERRTEVLYLQLRSTGIRLAEFTEAFDEDLLLHPIVRDLVAEDMVMIEHGMLSLTRKGYRFCDGIVTRLMETDRNPARQLEIANIIS